MLGRGATLSASAVEQMTGVLTPPLDDPETRHEVWRLLEPLLDAAARKNAGHVPGVATPEWWQADDRTKLAGVLILGLAWLVHDPDRAVRQRLREMSWDLSAAHDWSAASRRPSHAHLVSRRAELGPMARSFDAAAARRWVATGGSGGALG